MLYLSQHSLKSDQNQRLEMHCCFICKPKITLFFVLKLLLSALVCPTRIYSVYTVNLLLILWVQSKYFSRRFSIILLIQCTFDFLACLLYKTVITYHTEFLLFFKFRFWRFFAFELFLEIGCVNTTVDKKQIVLQIIFFYLIWNYLFVCMDVCLLCISKWLVQNCWNLLWPIRLP